jgi:hypothetical protein
VNKLDKTVRSWFRLDLPRADLSHGETVLKQFLPRRNHYGGIVQNS